MQHDENMPPSTPPARRRRRSIYEQDPDRGLGKIALFPSAYQCPWLGRDHLVYGSINWHDGTTVETDEGDCFESVGHWIQAEQRRELTRLQMHHLMQSLGSCPDTPAPFSKESGGGIVDENSSVDGSPSALSKHFDLEIEDKTLKELNDREEEKAEAKEEVEDEPFINTNATTAAEGLWVSTSLDEDYHTTEKDEYDFEHPNDPLGHPDHLHLSS